MFTTYQDTHRVGLVDGLIFETNILRVSPVNSGGRATASERAMVIATQNVSRLRMPAHRGKSFHLIFNHYKV